MGICTSCRWFAPNLSNVEGEGLRVASSSARRPDSVSLSHPPSVEGLIGGAEGPPCTWEETLRAGDTCSPHAPQ